MTTTDWEAMISLARFVADPLESDGHVNWLNRRARAIDPPSSPEWLVEWLHQRFDEGYLSDGQATPRAFGLVLVYLVGHPHMADREYLHEQRLDVLKCAAADAPPRNPQLRSWLHYRGVFI